MEEFYSDNENDYSSKKVATVMGLQPHSNQENDIWVLNNKVHINEDGQLIPPHTSLYIWLAAYTSEVASIPSCDMESSARDLEVSPSGLGYTQERVGRDKMQTFHGVKQHSRRQRSLDCNHIAIKKMTYGCSTIMFT